MFFDTLHHTTVAKQYNIHDYYLRLTGSPTFFWSKKKWTLSNPKIQKLKNQCPGALLVSMWSYSGFRNGFQPQKSEAIKMQTCCNFCRELVHTVWGNRNKLPGSSHILVTPDAIAKSRWSPARPVAVLVEGEDTLEAYPTEDTLEAYPTAGASLSPHRALSSRIRPPFIYSLGLL